jgi:hypothetical protein
MRKSKRLRHASPFGAIFPSPALRPAAKNAEDIIQRIDMTATISGFAYAVSGNPEYDRIRKVAIAA